MSFNPSKISYREWNFNKVQIESWFNCSAVFQLAPQDPGGNRISQGRRDRGAEDVEGIGYGGYPPECFSLRSLRSILLGMSIKRTSGSAIAETPRCRVGYLWKKVED